MSSNYSTIIPKQNVIIKKFNRNKLFIDITVLDTCGSITGALKAVMKAFVRADISCLYPPHYLGRINISKFCVKIWN